MRPDLTKIDRGGSNLKNRYLRGVRDGSGFAYNGGIYIRRYKLPTGRISCVQIAHEINGEEVPTVSKVKYIFNPLLVVRPRPNNRKKK